MQILSAKVTVKKYIHQYVRPHHHFVIAYSQYVLSHHHFVLAHHHFVIQNAEILDVMRAYSSLKEKG